MYSNTRFQQFLEDLPRSLVDRISAEYGSNRYDKSFDTYTHLVTLVFAQIMNTRSLRELEVGFNAHAFAHYHLGVSSLRRSTLSDANQRRNPEVFKELVENLMAGLHRQQRRELKDLLYLLDSSPIQLKGRGFEWAKDTATRNHQGIKLHLMIEAKTLSPAYLKLTPANINDITPAKQDIVPEAGATYVFDKGYTDYCWWSHIDQAGAYFVTRFKKNAGIECQEKRTIPEEEAERIGRDEIVAFRYKSNRGGHKNTYHGKALRRIEVLRPGERPLILATNDLESSASDIAELYRRRWGIELFFKWLKQNLKLKRFLGRSQNAVLLQLYAAIIAYLLLWRYQQKWKNAFSSLHLGMVQLQATLFQREETERHRRYRKRREEQAALLHKLQPALPL